MRDLSSISESLQKDSLEHWAIKAFDMASICCNESHDCCAYHQIWMLSRLLTSGSREPAGRTFFARHILNLLEKNPAPDVLISGAADTGLLAMVFKIFSAANTCPDLTLIDRCKSPVLLNQAYAQMLEFEVACIQANVLDFESSKVDLILAHSFLGFFDREERKDLFRNWASWLKPGGSILLSNRLETSLQSKPQLPTEKELSSYIDQLVGVASKLQLDEPGLELVRQAATRVWTRALSAGESVTREELENLAAESGLTLREIELFERSNKSGKGPLSIPYSNSGQRAEIRLEKN